MKTRKYEIIICIISVVAHCLSVGVAAKGLSNVLDSGSGSLGWIVIAGLFLFPILLIFLSGISLGIVQVRQQHRRWEIPVYVFTISVINFIVDSLIIVVATMMRDESLSGVWDVVKMYGVLLIICMIVGVVSGMLSSFITGIVCRTRR